MSMPENERSYGSTKIGKKQMIALIIVSIIILSLVLYWYYRENSSPLQFTIKIVDSPYDYENDRYYDITNKRIYYQIKNVGDKTFYYLDPEIGKNLDFVIKAENGTEYRYAGPVTYGLPFWKGLQSGEIENGTQMFGSKTSYPYYLEFGYTNWQNPDTGEYWFFQTGTYEIQGRFESRSNDNYENVLEGVWYSNTVTLKVE